MRSTFRAGGTRNSGEDANDSGCPPEVWRYKGLGATTLVGTIITSLINLRSDRICKTTRVVEVCKVIRVVLRIVKKLAQYANF